MLSSVRCISRLSVARLCLFDPKIYDYSVHNLTQGAEKHLKMRSPDTAEASIMLCLAKNKALKDYVEKLEKIHGVEIVPTTIQSPWTGKTFRQLTDLIGSKIDDEKEREIISGRSAATVLEVRGFSDNALDKEDVEDEMPSVYRFIEIVQKELPMGEAMALYLKQNLFGVDGE